VVLSTVKARLEASPERWEELDLAGILHKERLTLGLSTKVFMRVLRHALTGMKDGPGLADVMEVLGRERTIARLQ